MKARQLPWELLEQVFKVKVDDEPVLSLIDRVRCLAVCRLWRRVLDPRRLPLHSLDLTAMKDCKALPLLEWICYIKPAVLSFGLVGGEDFGVPSPVVQCAHRALLSLQFALLEKLQLKVDSSAAGQLWPAICQFLNLRELSLISNGPVVLDTGMLRSLPPQLSDLNVTLADVHIQGTGLLPSLTCLKVGYTEKLEVDSCLPSLIVLDAEEVDSVQLMGEQLQLPRLAALHLDCSEGTVEFRSTPALRQLDIWGPGPQALLGLTALHSLDILKFSNLTPETLGMTASTLQQAPATLRELQLALARPCLGREAVAMAVQLGPALGRLARLNYFASNSTAFLPYLRSLSGLRCLELQGLSAADLSIQDAEHLAAGFSSLEELAFGHKMPLDTARDLWLQLLACTLPGVCIVWQPEDELLMKESY